MKVTILVLAGVIALFVTVVLAGVILAAFVVRSGRKGAAGPPPTGPAAPRKPLSAEAVIAGCREQQCDAAAEMLEKALLPCVKLQPRAGDAVGDAFTTRIGGRPDLPEGTAWPKHNGKPLAFIAQINPDEIPPTAETGDLPRQGGLFFFYDASQETWGFDPKDRGSWRVIYIERMPGGIRAADFPDDLPAEARHPAVAMRLEAETSIPEPLDFLRGSDLTKRQQNAVFELYEAYAEGGTTRHRLLGHPDPVQGEMQLECQLASNGLYCGDSSGYNDPRAKALEAGAADWRLLLQVDTDERARMMWGDCGRLYFWIRAQDLRARNFDAAWMILQCA